MLHLPYLTITGMFLEFTILLFLTNKIRKISNVERWHPDRMCDIRRALNWSTTAPSLHLEKIKINAAEPVTWSFYFTLCSFMSKLEVYITHKANFQTYSQTTILQYLPYCKQLLSHPYSTTPVHSVWLLKSLTIHAIIQSASWVAAVHQLPADICNTFDFCEHKWCTSRSSVMRSLMLQVEMHLKAGAM